VPKHYPNEVRDDVVNVARGREPMGPLPVLEGRPAAVPKPYWPRATRTTASESAAR